MLTLPPCTAPGGAGHTAYTWQITAHFGESLIEQCVK